MNHDRAASFTAYVEAFEGPPPRRSLARALAVSPDTCTTTAHLFLPEVDPHAPLAEEAASFATAYRAFAGFQDLMELVLTDTPVEHRHYFYYESLIYLREIGLCLLAGNYLAVLTLQRPFLELAVFHVYWRSRPDEFAQFYRWIQTGVGKPPFKNAVEELIRNVDVETYIGDERTALIQSRVISLYAAACSYNHVAHIQDSYVAINAGNSPASARAAAVALGQACFCARQVLLLFGLSYPMVLFPRPLERKFGIGGPVGLFVPHETAALFAEAVGERNLATLKGAFSSHPEVTGKLEWFDAREDMDDDALEATWREHLRVAPMEDPPTETRDRMATARAWWRSVAGALNYANLPDPLEAASQERPEQAELDEMEL